MDDIIKKLSKIYNKTTFLDKYSSDLFITIIIFVIFFSIVLYFSLLNNIQPIKNDWVKNRCNPNVIPFAGIINAPEGTSKIDYTVQNFNNCINNISKLVTDQSIQPLYYIITLSATIANTFNGAFSSLKIFFDNFRNNISNFTSTINNQAFNFTPPFIQLTILIKDTVNKIKGVFASLIYSLYGSYLSLKGMTKVMYDASVAVIAALVIFIVLIMLIPIFGWIVGIPLIAVVAVILIPMAQTAIIMKKVLKLTNIKNVPSNAEAKKKEMLSSKY